MRYRDVVWWAQKSVRESKTRTILTALGVMIGIAAIISLQAISKGFQEAIFQQLFKLNPDTIFVMPKVGVLSDTDASRIMGVEGVARVAPLVTGSVKLFGTGGSKTFKLVGVEPDDLSLLIRGGELWKGRLYKALGEAVVGWSVAHPPGIPYNFVDAGKSYIAKTFDSEGKEHTFTIRVVGVYKRFGASVFLDPDKTVFVNIKTAREMLGAGGYSVILVIASDASIVDEVSKRVDLVLGGKADVYTASQIRQVYDNISRQINNLLAGVAFISLVVAGVGIMNVMLINVTERTREIGVLKALGFTSRQVMLMFLSEAMAIGLIGTMAGILMGVVMAYGASNVLSFKVTGEIAAVKTEPIFYPHHFLIALAFGLLVSVISGVYPARKAASLDPAVALRHE